MVEALGAGVLCSMAVACLVAIRYGYSRTRQSLLYTAILGIEIIFLGVLLLVLSSQLFFKAPWLDVDLEPLLKETVASAIVVVVLGACFCFATRLEAQGKQTQGALLFGAATALLIGALLLGIWVAQVPGTTPTPIGTPTSIPTPNTSIR